MSVSRSLLEDPPGLSPTVGPAQATSAGSSRSVCPGPHWELAIAREGFMSSPLACRVGRWERARGWTQKGKAKGRQPGLCPTGQ